MNQLAETTERLPMNAVGMSSGSTGAKIAPQNLSEVVKFAEVMCRADIALPKHLRGNAGACMAVALQALDWQMNPFAVASKSYSVNGTIAYEAQLLVAVVNTRSGIEGRIRYRFEGEGADRVCYATGKLEGEEYEVRSPKFKDITPKNSPLWKSDPDQQHCYYTGRAWARRYTPEVILGIYDRDEAEQFSGPDNARDITPQPSVMQRLRQNATQGPADGREGFSETFVHSETSDALNGEILTENDTPESVSSPETGNADAPTPASAEGGDPQPSPSPIADDELRMHLMDFARKGLRTAADEALGDKRADAIEEMILGYRDAIPESDWGKLSTIKISLQAVLAGKRTIDQARAFLATDLLDCDPRLIGGAA